MAGRPKIEITPEQWDQAQAMAKIHCTRDEIAALLDISADTLVAAIKSKGYEDFSAWFKKYSAGGKMSLRRKQYQMVMEQSSVPMAIWLGKNMLGQRDEPKEQITQKPTRAFDPSKLSREEYKQAIKDSFAKKDDD